MKNAAPIKTPPVPTEPRDALIELWHRLATDPDIPEHYELNEWGEVVWKPRAGKRHQRMVSTLSAQLHAQRGGLVVPTVALLTRQAGIRIPDIVWLPEEDMLQLLTGNPLTRMPVFIVEVCTRATRQVATQLRVRAYLDLGACEVLVVESDGHLVWHRADGAHASSALGLKFDLSPDQLVSAAETCGRAG